MLHDPSAVALVVVGVLAVVAAILWRRASYKRRLAVIARALSAPEPKLRIEAARQLTSTGLDRAAPILLEFVPTEPDTSVLAAIALAVLQRQWEPNGSRRVQKLRWWSGMELERQGIAIDAFPAAFTRLSDMGGPRLPAPIKPESDSDAAGTPTASDVSS